MVHRVAVVLRREQSARRGLDAEDVKVVAADELDIRSFPWRRCKADCLRLGSGPARLVFDLAHAAESDTGLTDRLAAGGTLGHQIFDKLFEMKPKLGIHFALDGGTPE
jgi:hypothetical protein